MGSSIAVAIQQNGQRVLWASEGRSEDSHMRAEKANLEDAGNLPTLVIESGLILSVCPPEFSPQTGANVSESGFKGIYVDANAISPARSRELGVLMEKIGVSYVDGSIVGSSDFSKGSSYLYLSGPKAPLVSEIFEGSDLHVVVLDGPLGAASALKMCYAAWTKGSAALLSGILSLAKDESVLDELWEQWKVSQKGLYTGAEQRVLEGTAKAWRFAGEMEEIANAFLGSSLPDGFHRAAAEIYRRQSGFKDASELPPLDEVIRTVLGSKS
ncbi:MAG: hypothetical protein DF168_00484 [Candidatus Moanabacter tarae]|uniref:Phosphogluconate dehydrogenase NAD-binding putative C-terminal domain-containing protein n=1 Tax=Candidatus Moanibacter tarae TaxID=2200854 RepID=A0A2Z4AKP6_9BACT|nr:MAG: hypothetical protein DF168_00484 [Candidatus Moanabacter tarae]|tara:strand:+ start:11677 stop:12486 length:810 start_codon:yes stop_codon:yes gene_type:complete